MLFLIGKNQALCGLLAELCPIPSSTTNLGECEHDTPHLALVSKTIFSDDFQFGIPGAGLVSLLRHEQRQAHAQWPECTNKRADSKAERC